MKSVAADQIERSCQGPPRPLRMLFHWDLDTRRDETNNGKNSDKLRGRAARELQSFYYYYFFFTFSLISVYANLATILKYWKAWPETFGEELISQEGTFVHYLLLFLLNSRLLAEMPV